MLDTKRESKLFWNIENREYRYRNNRKVSDKVLYEVVSEKIYLLENEVSRVTEDLLAKRISIQTWTNKVSELVRNGHVNLVRFGKGGKNQTFAYDYLEVANELKNVQYKKLKEFSTQIREGKLTENRIRQRALLYARSVRVSFERGRKNTKSSNYKAARLLGSCAPHCAPCIEYASRGYVSLDDIIFPTQQCDCYNNCCCTLVYTDKIYLKDSESFDQEDLDKTFSEYNKLVNMSYSQLKSWSNTKYSKAASLDRSPIIRNLELLQTKKSNWTKKHIRWARKTIAFISRMKKVKQGDNVSKDIPYSKRDISLKNWAYDPKK